MLGVNYRGISAPKGTEGVVAQSDAGPAVVRARIFLFPLDALRSQYPAAGEGRGPGSDTGPFLAFRSRLLAELSPCVQTPAELSAWWEGTYNGYHLAVAVSPPGALSGAFEPESICPLEAERIAPVPRNGYPLARLEPGGWTLAGGEAGETYEFPFGVAAGHFGAPGVLVRDPQGPAGPAGSDSPAPRGGREAK